MSACVERLSANGRTPPLPLRCCQNVNPPNCRAGLGSAAFYGAGAPESAASDQAMALLLLKGSLDPSGQALGSWQESTSPCQGWSGVTCNSDGRVTRLCAPRALPAARGVQVLWPRRRAMRVLCVRRTLAGACNCGVVRRGRAVWVTGVSQPA